MALSRAIRERRAKEAIANAERQLKEAQEQLDKLTFPESPGIGAYKIDVRFERGGILYEFLVLIARNHTVYTTAVKDGGVFKNFDAFVEWLRGKDPYEASRLSPVVVDYNSDLFTEIV